MISRALRSFAPAIIVGVGGLLFWELSLQILQPEGFLLPAPSAIIASLFENVDEIWVATKNTGYIVVTGLVAGVVSGGVWALLVSRFRLADETLTPLAISLNAIPIIALAPIFNAWFGLLSPVSNQAIVAMLVFFPVFINTTKGLTEVGATELELMRSYAASSWQVARIVRIPNAMPFFFTALKIASSLAVIGAIVAEYFGGRQDALGPLIVQNAGLTRYAEAWAAVLAGSIMGILLYFVSGAFERVAMPWKPDLETEGS
ncbi:MAG: ABC transporter permease [Acidimicrobiia bacterium]|nr:MAG: ABC transporter permease [Acidimicrobiia bacterium]